MIMKIINSKVSKTTNYFVKNFGQELRNYGNAIFHFFQVKTSFEFVKMFFWSKLFSVIIF